MPVPHRPVVLVIRDGWGHNPRADQDFCNATVQANTPVADRLLAEYPHVQIKTSGTDVGLPPGVMGNSEVGHQNLGAGRIVDQELMRITNAVKSGAFMENPTLLEAVNRAKSSAARRSTCWACAATAASTATCRHLLALIDLCADAGLPNDALAVHAITDGRDTAPNGGAAYLAEPSRRNWPTAGSRRSPVGRRPVLRHGPRLPLGPRLPSLRFISRPRRGDRNLGGSGFGGLL